MPPPWPDIPPAWAPWPVAAEIELAMRMPVRLVRLDYESLTMLELGILLMQDAISAVPVGKKTNESLRILELGILLTQNVISAV